MPRKQRRRRERAQGFCQCGAAAGVSGEEPFARGAGGAAIFAHRSATSQVTQGAIFLGGMHRWHRKRRRSIRRLLDLQYCTITAPVAGVVNKHVEVGMNVQPGQTINLGRADGRCVGHRKFQRDATERHEVGPAGVTIEVDAYRSGIQGKVESLAGATGAQFSLLPPENATGNYVKVVQRVPVKIVLDPKSEQRSFAAAGNVGGTESQGEMSEAASAMPARPARTSRRP